MDQVTQCPKCGGFKGDNVHPIEQCICEHLENKGDNSMELTKGEYVAVYEDALTKEKFESNAQLSNCLSAEDEDGCSIWTVRFVETNDYYVRTVHKSDRLDDFQENHNEESQ